LLSFASTWGPCAWVVIGEIFPLPIRSRGVGLSTASNWFWNCIIAIITPYIVDKQYANLSSKIFFMWGSLCIINVLFAYFLVPETKSLSLEQVDRMLEEVSPRHSGPGFLAPLSLLRWALLRKVCPLADLLSGLIQLKRLRLRLTMLPLARRLVKCSYRVVLALLPSNGAGFIQDIERYLDKGR
jgi:hypothetical protein